MRPLSSGASNACAMRSRILNLPRKSAAAWSFRPSPNVLSDPKS